MFSIESKSKGQLMSAISSAVSKKTSKASLTVNSISSPLSADSSPRSSDQTPEDDHGFKNRDLQQEVNQSMYSDVLTYLICVIDAASLLISFF